MKKINNTSLALTIGFVLVAASSTLAQNQRVNDVIPLSISTNNIAFENAFKINQDFILKVVGTDLDKLKFEPSNSNYTIVDHRVAGSTSTEWRIRVKYAIVSNKVEILRANFKLISAVPSLNGQQLTRIQSEFPSNNRPFFKTFNKPNLKPVSITGTFNRKRGAGCPQINNLSGNDQIVKDVNLCIAKVANPTTTNQTTQAEVTIPKFVLTIRNTSNALISQDFNVEMKNGINLISTQRVTQNLVAGQSITLTFDRPFNRKVFMRNQNCPDCYELRSGEFGWSDPAYTFIVDANNEVDESAEGAGDNHITSPATAVVD